MLQAHQEQVGHRPLTADDGSHQEDGQLLSPARCNVERLCSQRSEPYGGTMITPSSSWSSGWWMMSPQHGRVFFLPACFNSVWLQVPNIAQAFTSDVMVDCLSTNRYEVIGCPVVWRTARWRWFSKIVENLKPLMPEFLAFFWVMITDGYLILHLWCPVFSHTNH